MSLEKAASNSLVSVVIPVKNRFDLLKEALDSVALQNNVLEVLLIDDSTEPGLKELCAGYDGLDIRIYPNASRGIGGARNTGLTLAQGDFVAFLDSDDIWEKGFIANSINRISETKDCSGSIAFSQIFYDGTLTVRQRFLISSLNILKKIFLILMFYFNNGRLLIDSPFLVQISHAVFKRKNLPKFREDLNSSEDWIFALEAQLANGPLKIIPKKMLFMRYSAKSSSFALAERIETVKSQNNLELLRLIKLKTKPGFIVTLFRIYNRYFLVRGV